MFYPVSSQLYPSHTVPRNEPIVQPLAAMRANIMPTLQQTIYGLAPVENVGKSNRYEESGFQSKISHPRLAPSSISSEEYLKARFSLAHFIIIIWRHAMREHQIYMKRPRFKDQIDLLA